MLKKILAAVVVAGLTLLSVAAMGVGTAKAYMYDCVFYRLNSSQSASVCYHYTGSGVQYAMAHCHTVWGSYWVYGRVVESPSVISVASCSGGTTMDSYSMAHS